ncbi:MAG: Gfo/Idh/MocA family oxidoreductase [Chloroflexota bacterium]
MSKQPIRWGILGPGSISHKFAQGLLDADGAVMAAVGSRSRDRAQTFADKFGFARVHDSYDALVNDPEVDAIYIGTPHNFHKEHTLLCLEHGKHVICEKPFAINAAEAEVMVAKVRETGLVLMEAMWSRFLPTLVKTRALLAAGAIGDVRMITADFGFRAGSVNPASRLFNPAMGGGALLDVGIYPLSLAYMVAASAGMGDPSRIESMAHLGETGVDEQSAFILGYDGGALALLSTAIRTNTPHEAYILGTNGSIKIESPWWVSSHVTLKAGGKEETFDLPFKGNGYTHEAEEVMDLIRKGETESAVISLDESLAIVRAMDTIRAQWGLKYPME